MKKLILPVVAFIFAIGGAIATNGASKTLTTYYTNPSSASTPCNSVDCTGTASDCINYSNARLWQFEGCTTQVTGVKKN